jgi:hypothetical protein
MSTYVAFVEGGEFAIDAQLAESLFREDPVSTRAHECVQCLTACCLHADISSFTAHMQHASMNKGLPKIHTQLLGDFCIFMVRTTKVCMETRRKAVDPTYRRVCHRS